MSLDLPHLDAWTRRYMLAELEADVVAGALYYSPQLSEGGTEDSFARSLAFHEAVTPPNRWQHPREVGPGEALADATFRLAEREFHRFYIRGLCVRAIEQDVDTFVIYRARPADSGRSPADTMIGVRIAVRSLLEDLRGTFRSLPPHGLPQCRDPGLSVRLPDDRRWREDDAYTVRSAAR